MIQLCSILKVFYLPYWPDFQAMQSGLVFIGIEYRHNEGKIMKRYQLFMIAALALATLNQAAVGGENSGFSPHVDKSGKISMPRDFRNNMVHLGSWFVPKGDASGFHDVYTEAQTVKAFRKTGKFPDGATLVKELRHANTGDYTTSPGVGYANGQVKIWFVMIKDSKGRFNGNKIWGDGWGWALFKPDAPGKNTSTNYKADCLACHMPAKDKDWVYTEGYPTLSAPVEGKSR